MQVNRWLDPNVAAAVYPLPSFPAPANTVVPAITGTAQDGETLTGSLGTWTGSPGLARQWQIAPGPGFTAWTDITGETAETYDVVTADVGKKIRLKVTGSNPGGTVSVFSDPTDEVIAA